MIPSLLVLFLTAPVFGAPHSELGYVVNTFIILLAGALVMWMAAGFCMLESGLVRNKNVAIICLKNLLVYSVSCICFYVIGYNLMFTDVQGWMGSLIPLASVGNSEEDYSSFAMIFFQMTFVGAAASVVSGALAERVRLWAFFVFTAVLTAFIYPIQGSWVWGGGWLSEMGFSDFAGSTVVHSVGGWAALAGALVLGPRRDKYGKNGEIKNYFPSNVSLVTLGVFILWFGWLGFNGGSLLVFSDAPSVSKLALIFMNTNIAACSGAVVALFLGRIVYGRVNILLVLNGALAGLVSITAGPDYVQPVVAMIIGGVGSCFATLTPSLLDKLKIDDVVGAIPVHLVAGIWGTLAVGIWGEASLFSQIIGIVSVGAFSFISCLIVWLILKSTMGIRVSKEYEELGQDLLELDMESDPEAVFSLES